MVMAAAPSASLLWPEPERVLPGPNGEVARNNIHSLEPTGHFSSLSKAPRPIGVIAMRQIPQAFREFFLPDAGELHEEAAVSISTD